MPESEKGMDRIRVDISSKNGAQLASEIANLAQKSGSEFNHRLMAILFGLRDQFKDEVNTLRAELERERHRRKELEEQLKQRVQVANRERHEISLGPRVILSALGSTLKT